MECKLENGSIIVKLPFNKAGRDCKPSKDGTVKSRLHASSGGFIPTGINVDGKPVKLNVTAITPK